MSRRKQILTEVIQMFDEVGFTSDFTMSEIANRVQIGKSTIYEYFSNKDDLIKEALFLYLEGGINEINVSDDIEDLSLEEAFKKQLSVLLEVASKSRRLLETLSPGFLQKLPVSLQEEMKLKMEDTRKKLEKRFAVFFQKGYEEGVIKQPMTPEKGFLLRSIVVGAIMTFSIHQDIGLIPEVVDNVYKGILHIIEM